MNRKIVCIHAFWIASLVFAGISVADRDVSVPIELPTEWKGTLEGKSDGNPFLVDQAPRWRLDHLWPPDWREPTNFKPLVWVKGHWGLAHRVEEEQYGCPQAQISHGGITLKCLSVRGDTTEPCATKTAVLVFIPGVKNSYLLNGTIAATTDVAGESLRVTIFKHALNPEKIKKLSEEDIKSGESIAYKDFAFSLNVGEELMIASFGKHPRVTGTLDIDDLSIRPTPTGDENKK